MIADCWRPGGYFSICFFAQATFSAVKVKVAGCSSFGARRRTDMVFSLSMNAALGERIQAVNTVFPERAGGAEYVVTDVGGDLDAVEDRQVR